MSMDKQDRELLQRVFRKAGFYRGNIDGIIGPKTREAAIRGAATPINVRGNPVVAAAQIMLNKLAKLPAPLVVDGFYGPATEAAGESYVGAEVWRDDHMGVSDDNDWPRYRDASSYYGAPGTNQVLMTLPYQMVLAWDEDTSVNRFSINKRCADSAKLAMQKTLDFYGYDRIVELGLHKFGGCLNVRKMRGGTQMSTHSWGSAIDFDPARNRLRWNRGRAELAKPAYRKFWSFWQEAGWTSLGLKKDYDWMHVQAMT